MSEITVLILTYNEEIHIERCIRSLLTIAKRIVIIDSFSTDRTVELARSLGAEVVQRAWKNHADQFQWGLENCQVETPWLMRMDADEYLEPALQDEIPPLLADLSANIGGVYIKRKVLFMGKWIRYGGFYPQILLRIWRTGLGHVEQRWMDEHIVLIPGSITVTTTHDIVDDNQKGISFWIAKHNQYASREAADVLNQKYNLFPRDDSLKLIDDPQAKRKRILKEKFYNKMPLGLRAFLYFLFRYIFQFGFLDGSRGFIWHFLQGFWYRLLVDLKIMDILVYSHGDVEQMKKTINDRHGIEV
jgi:glycosyltransferase involved in cell wall biosynthesis